MAGNSQSERAVLPERTTLEVGIGIITYNRLHALQGCVEALERDTTAPYRWVIGDDGSGDGTVRWAREQGLRVITGPRRGVAWNRNRVLYYLAEQTECDPVLLMDDDCWPVESGWEQAWVGAAERWGHVAFTFLGPEPHPSGSGTAEDPYRGGHFGGPCTATSRSALLQVGYFDTRFVGYGYEDIDWAFRFRRLLAEKWGPPHDACPSMVSGLKIMSFGSWFDAEENAKNARVFQEIQGEPLWRPAWRNREEEEIFRAEQAGAEQPLAGDLDLPG